MIKFGVELMVLCIFAVCQAQFIDYSGYKVLTITPKTEQHLDLIRMLRNNYSVDLWNDPRGIGIPVMTHLKPELANYVEELLKQNEVNYFVAFSDLNSVIENERIQHSPASASHVLMSPGHVIDMAEFDPTHYHDYDTIMDFIQGLVEQYPQIVKLQTIGTSYENRPIQNLKISSGNSSNKQAIMMDCGIHAREWSSVAAGAYLLNKLVTTYGSDPVVTGLVDKYEFNIVLVSNPDGYIYTWQNDRMWRKTRSRSSRLDGCYGADANRNFDVDHCGVGSNSTGCDETYCGDAPFSENESRALRDLMVTLQGRLVMYVSLHAYSQLWMTPYGTTKELPPNYDELIRIGTAGVNALEKRFNTSYKIGSIANIIYEASGSATDYAYVKQNVKIVFALELRDTGKYGFFLPKDLILPTCEETYDGLTAAIQAL